jgi:hypothetical protein
MVPGSKSDEEDFRILETMPVRSIITAPGTGTQLPSGTWEVALRGAAWARGLTESRVDVSADSGQAWTQATLAPPATATIGTDGRRPCNCPRTSILKFGPALRTRKAECSRLSPVTGTRRAPVATPCTVRLAWWGKGY